MPNSSSARPFVMSHVEGSTVAPNGEINSMGNKAVADSIRVEVQRLKAMEKALEEDIAAQNNSTHNNNGNGIDRPDVFPSYISTTLAAAGGPKSLAAMGAEPAPAFPLKGSGGGGGSSSSYSVDLAKTGRAANFTGVDTYHEATVNGGPNRRLTNNNATSSTNVGNSSNVHSSSVAFAHSAAGMARSLSPTALRKAADDKYLAYYQEHYDGVLAARREKEEADRIAKDIFYGGAISDERGTNNTNRPSSPSQNTTTVITASQQQQQKKDGSNIVDRFYTSPSAGGGGGGDPLSVIQPFAAESDDVESGISDVRSSILELKHTREQRKLVAMLEEKARVGRTIEDDNVEAMRRDAEASRQISVIAAAQQQSPNRHPKAHAALAVLYSSHVANMTAAAAAAGAPPKLLGNMNGGSTSSSVVAPTTTITTTTAADDSNQHGLYVQQNSDKEAMAAAQAAVAAAYELEQVPFANSRIGKEFADRRRRVYSATVARAHEEEVAQRQQFINNSTASVTFSDGALATTVGGGGGDGNNTLPINSNMTVCVRNGNASAIVDNSNSVLNNTSGVVMMKIPSDTSNVIGSDPTTTVQLVNTTTAPSTLPPSPLPPLVSSFVASRHIPNTLPRTAHTEVVAGAYHTILQTAAQGKPIVNLDDLAEEPRVLVQCTSVVPISGKTAFTVPLTLATPLRVLHQEIMKMAKASSDPRNQAIVEGEAHARSASAAWPQSATYRAAVLNAHDSAVFRGKISASAAAPSYQPSINNNYATRSVADMTRDAVAAAVPPKTGLGGVVPSRTPSASNRPSAIVQQRPLARPNSSLVPTADGGVTLYAAGTDTPLDMDKSFLEQGFRFPPLVMIRGFRREYYLCTAGSDRRVPCPWRPHMTLTDVAKDIGKRLFPNDFRYVRASIAVPSYRPNATAAASSNDGNGSGGAGQSSVEAGISERFDLPIDEEASKRYVTRDGLAKNTTGKDAADDYGAVEKRRVFLPFGKSIRFQCPDLIEGNPYLFELGLGMGEMNSTCAVQFLRTVKGEPFLASNGHVSTNSTLHEYCREAAAACQSMLDQQKQELFTRQSAEAMLGRARTTRAAVTSSQNQSRVTSATAGPRGGSAAVGQGVEGGGSNNTNTNAGGEGAAVFVLNGVEASTISSVDNPQRGLDNIQFDDEDEAVSPDGLYSIYRHRDIEEQTGIPTFSFNPTRDFVAESTFPYFITTEEDYTIRHAADVGVVPGTEVLVEYFDTYRKLWSGEVLVPMRAMYEPLTTHAADGGGDSHGDAADDGNNTSHAVKTDLAGVQRRNIVAASTQKGAPITALTAATAARSLAGGKTVFGEAEASLVGKGLAREAANTTMVRGAGGKEGDAFVDGGATVMGISRIHTTAADHHNYSAGTATPLPPMPTSAMNASAPAAILLSTSTQTPPPPSSASYPIDAKEDQYGRLLIMKPKASDRYDLLTITTGRGQRLRMFAHEGTRIEHILNFIWAQTGDCPHETYLWLDHGAQLTQHFQTLGEAGVVANATIHARRRPRVWLGEQLAPPVIDRTLSYTTLPDAQL